MQTRLQIAGMVVVASLLWTFPTSAATESAKANKKVKNDKLHYVGIASWYGEQHQGRIMANGQPFDRRKLTAASWYFPPRNIGPGS
jgi:rare lipoprotein A (peptidoglycan hydrolase)